METPHLTPKEKEVLTLLAANKHNKEIATLLNISEHTVKFHINSILRKTGQTTRLGAVMHGMKTYLLPQPTPLTATAIAIIEDNKVNILNIKTNMLNDIYEVMDTFAAIDEQKKEIAEILNTYFPTNDT